MAQFVVRYAEPLETSKKLYKGDGVLSLREGGGSGVSISLTLVRFEAVSRPRGCELSVEGFPVSLESDAMVHSSQSVLLRGISFLRGPLERFEHGTINRSARPPSGWGF